MTEKQSVTKSHFLIGWNSSSFVFLRIHIHAADHISCVKLHFDEKRNANSDENH